LLELSYLLSFIVVQLVHPDGMPLFSLVLFLPNVASRWDAGGCFYGCLFLFSFVLFLPSVHPYGMCFVSFLPSGDSKGMNLFP